MICHLKPAASAVACLYGWSLNVSMWERQPLTERSVSNLILHVENMKRFNRIAMLQAVRETLDNAS